jgi:GAF domain-containing protein
MVSPESLPRPDSEREENVGRLWEAIASAADHADSLEEAAQECLDAVCRLTGWPVGHLYVPAGQYLVPTGIWHLEDRARFAAFHQATTSTSFAIGIGLPGEVAASGRPVWIEDLARHPNFPRQTMANDLGVRSGFAFPILLDTEVVAVLEFFSPDLTSLDQALLDLVARVGNQLSRVVERQRAAEQLASSDERLRRILDTANESFISMDADGRITEWNQCAESTFGWLRHEVLGRPLDEVLIPERHREAHRQGSNVSLPLEKEKSWAPRSS